MLCVKFVVIDFVMYKLWYVLKNLNTNLVTYKRCYHNFITYNFEILNFATEPN